MLVCKKTHPNWWICVCPFSHWRWMTVSYVFGTLGSVTSRKVEAQRLGKKALWSAWSRRCEGWHVSEADCQVSCRRFLVCSCSTGVAPQVQWRAIKDRRSLRTDHVMTPGRQAMYRKHPNRTLNIVCTSCVTLSLWLFCSTEVKRDGGGCFLTTYPHAFLRWNIRDLLSFQVKSWVGDGSLLC